jgi:hypothetical protein
MEALNMIWKYDINLIGMAGNQPVHAIEVAPLRDEQDAIDFIEYDWDNYFKLRNGFIAVPFKSTDHYEVRDYDLQQLEKAWENARQAIHSAQSKTIKCKSCECSFPRSILKGAQCPMCYEILGGNTNANRVRKWQEKVKDNAKPTIGINWLVKDIKE